MKPKRNIYIKYHKTLPSELMKGTIKIPYTGEIILGYDRLPDDFDEDLDWEILCDCDLGEIQGFIHT